MFIEKRDYKQPMSLRKQFLKDLNKEFIQMRFNEEELRNRLQNQIKDDML